MKKLLIIASIFILSTTLLIPGIAFADDGNNGEKSESDLGLSSGNEIIIPKIEVQTPGWLIISYGEKVKDKKTVSEQLDAFLADRILKILSKDSVDKKDNEYIICTTSTFSKSQDVNFGNSYVRGYWYTTGTWIGDGSEDWYGSSGSAWFGTSPSYNCDIIADHELWLIQADFTSVPSGWDDFYPSITSSPSYIAYDTWWLGTAWSSMQTSTTWDWATMTQRTTSYFDFDYPGNDPTTIPYDSFLFGK
jgi:hypothetical protein